MRSFMQAFVDLGHLQVATDPEIQLVIRRYVNGSSIRSSNMLEGQRERLRDLLKQSRKNNGDVNIYIDTTFATKFTIIKPISVLKVDVEGAEWDAFGGISHQISFVSLSAHCHL